MAEPRDDAIRARYRALATEEPSAAIDAALRAAARRAVASAPREARRSRTSRWAVPASLAAVVLLSFGVVMRMEQEVPPFEIETKAGATSSVAPAVPPPEPKVLAEAPRVAVAPQRAPEPAKSAPKEKQAAGGRVAETVAKPEPKQAVPAPAPFKATPPALAKDSAGTALPVATPAAPPAAASAAPSAAMPSAPAPQPRAFSDAAPTLRAPMEEQRNVAPAARRDESAGASDDAAVPRAKSESFAAPRAAESAVAREALPWPDTPEKKLERIESLRVAGRDREADEAIARLRREHPDYRIPDAVWERIKPR